MDTVDYNNLKLIKRDIRTLKEYIIKDDNIHDWDKIIIVYNFYLIFVNLYYSFNLIDYLSKNNDNFILQFMVFV